MCLVQVHLKITAAVPKKNSDIACSLNQFECHDGDKGQLEAAQELQLGLFVCLTK
jgi:hypothetical protein